MRLFLSTAVCFFCVATTATFAQNGGFTAEIKSPVSKVLIPAGFDSNDVVEVILQGVYPNSCHKVGKSSSSLVSDKNTVFIDANSYYLADRPCIMIPRPFIQTVTLGVLPIDPNKEEETFYAVLPGIRDELKPFKVAQARTAGRDDFIYAPVKEVDLTEDEVGVQTLKLTGTYPADEKGCWVIDDIAIDMSVEHLIVVQPKMKLKEKTLENCDLRINVSKNLEAPFRGDGVIHVRTFDEDPINQYIDMH